MGIAAVAEIVKRVDGEGGAGLLEWGGSGTVFELLCYEWSLW